jgi:uncharacterized membrane protein (Fun14 family)
MTTVAFDGVIFGLIVGFLRRGSLKGFASLNLKYGWMFPLLLLVQFVVYALQSHIVWVAAASTYTFMLVYIIGFVFLWLNRKESALLVVLVGAFLNFLVMLANGGRMPVSLEAAEAVLDPYYVEILRNGTLYGKHAIMTAHTHLAFLGDIIPLAKPYYKQQVISIGDVVESIGIFLYIQKVMLSGRKDATAAVPAEQA